MRRLFWAARLQVVVVRCAAVTGVLATSTGCGVRYATTVLMPAHAEPMSNGYGVSVSWWATVAAHSDERGDSTWRIRGNDLELCRGASAECVRVPTGSLTPATLVVPRRDERAQEALHSRNRAEVAPLNGVWVRGAANSLFDFQRAPIAFCWAGDDAPRCRLVALQANHFVSYAVAAMALERPNPPKPCGSR
jgi:hypothetical protein